MNDEKKPEPLPQVAQEDIDRIAFELDSVINPEKITLGDLIIAWLEDKDAPITDAFAVHKYINEQQQHITKLDALEWQLNIVDDEITYKDDLGESKYQAADPAVLDVLKGKILVAEKRAWARIGSLFQD